jgi:trehalose 6-phosphate synthase
VKNHKIQYKDRTISLGKYVVGIDFQRFTDAMNDRAIQSRIQELETLYKDKTVIIGVDRMDYTKGLPEKLEGFRVFLDEHPEWSEKVVLIQIAIPSREEVKEYKALEEEVSKLAGQIIGKHGKDILTLCQGNQRRC